MASNIRNVQSLKGTTDRSLGEQIDIGGTGLAVIGRAPLLATVRLDDREASDIPLAPGLVIAQKFERFWLFHPYTEGGTFRLGIIQGADWLQFAEPSERLRAAVSLRTASVAGQSWFAAFTNPPAPTLASFGQRLVRLESIRLNGLAGSNRYRVFLDNPAAAYGATGTPLTFTAGARDSRMPGVGSALPSPIVCQLTTNSNLAIVQPGAAFDEIAFNAAVAPELVYPVDCVLVPGTAIRLELEDTSVIMNVGVTVFHTEEPFN